MNESDATEIVVAEEGPRPDGTRAQRFIGIAWWNTHLSPPVPKAVPLHEDDRSLALETILQLALDNDVVALGEVSTSELTWLRDYLPSEIYSVADLTQGATRNRFNIGLIFKRDNCQLLDFELLTDRVGGQSFKIAAHLNLLFDDSLQMNVLAVHWSSRLTKGEADPDRTHFGNSLRRRIEEIRKDENPHIVVLGDFNDEPFDTPVTKYLRATRDAGFLKEHPDLLYNPFWKSITCRVGYSRTGGMSEPTGTYFLSGDGLHKWRVYDQMLFSSSFLGGSEWHLEEAETGVLRPPKLVSALTGRNSKLDHLPIFCKISREATDGELQR
ncbi:endonuclease/exonuclease/phosphatase family protein [Agrobacterium tumefaciens]|uniref:endonuclease/exonuclease/phosphatase family protein n=1 Tax=Agrobacterium tumefaciens TaxID=358 RepID=UPI00023A56C2|nr:endonuclease/exonuclease/phosphatase [Agrobacterium tumefaciens 5A]